MMKCDRADLNDVNFVTDLDFIAIHILCDSVASLCLVEISTMWNSVVPSF